MQMISEVGAEQNTTTIIMMPSEFVTMAKGVAESLTRNGTAPNRTEEPAQAGRLNL
jgi:hypothetical protein